MLRDFFVRQVLNAAKQNENNILSFIQEDENSMFLDLGCDNGKWTKILANKIRTENIYGVDIVLKSIKEAENRKINVCLHDLNNETLPFDDNSFDIIHANQVIEHLYNTDLFLSEIYRIVKPNKQVIISTENLSSWHNIAAAILGFQPFSMTNYSNEGNIGNPFALFNNRKTEQLNILSWQHNRLFSYFGLKDLFEKHGFIVDGIKTAGYYPLFGIMAKLDPIHGHWMTVKAHKT